MSTIASSFLNAIDNLKEVSSESRDNMSVVSLEFEYGADLSEAANDIRDALSLLDNFMPEDADAPMILKISSSMVPILMYAVTANESYEGIEQMQFPVRRLKPNPPPGHRLMGHLILPPFFQILLWFYISFI